MPIAYLLLCYRLSNWQGIGCLYELRSTFAITDIQVCSRILKTTGAWSSNYKASAS